MAAVSVKQLREERADIIAKARQINDTHGDENGNLAAEFQEQFDKAMDQAAEKAAVIKRVEKLEAAELALQRPVAGGGNPGSFSGEPGDGGREPQYVSVRSGKDERGNPHYHDIPVGERGASEYRESFAKYLQVGDKGMTSDDYAALQSDDSDQAGYLLASEQFAAGLLKAVDDMTFVRRHAKVHTVREADSLGIRKRTAKASTHAWTSELAVATEDSTLAFGKKVLTPQHLTGQLVISRDLVRRSTMGIEQIVRDELSRDAGEVQEQAFLTGSGAEEPLGVFTASSDGISTSRDVITGSTTNFTADGLVAAKYALKQNYRNGGDRSGARWLFHRDGIKLISQLKDGDNHYMLQPARGLTGDEWDTLLGYPVDESEFAPNTFTDGQYSGMLCNWNYYEIADALSMEVQVLFELLARQNQIIYINRMKTDGLPTLEEAFVRIKCATS